MEYKELGKTGLQVSAIGFGSVELGMDYGIKGDGEYGKPDREEAEKVIHKAVDLGINLFDTAPSYGDSESLLGEVIGHSSCYIATKVNIPAEKDDAFRFIERSIEDSLKRLQRDCLDIVQIHNATADTINNSDVPGTLMKFQEKGLIRFTGASVYEPVNAMAVVEIGCFDVLQIAYNILDQRMASEVIPLAKSRGVGILGRSAYFKGVLTAKAQYISRECDFLREAAGKIKSEMNLGSWNELAELAMAFCLSGKGIDCVLAGIRTMEELDFAIGIQNKEILSADVLERLSRLCIEDKYWLNPSNWPMM